MRVGQKAEPLIVVIDVLEFGEVLHQGNGVSGQTNPKALAERIGQEKDRLLGSSGAGRRDWNDERGSRFPGVNETCDRVHELVKHRGIRPVFQPVKKFAEFCVGGIEDRMTILVIAKIDAADGVVVEDESLPSTTWNPHRSNAGHPTVLPANTLRLSSASLYVRSNRSLDVPYAAYRMISSSAAPSTVARTSSTRPSTASSIRY